MTFAKWLKQQKHRDDPVGMLARDHTEDCRQCVLGVPNRVGQRKGSTFAWWKSHITTVHSPGANYLAALEAAGLEYKMRFPDAN